MREARSAQPSWAGPVTRLAAPEHRRWERGGYPGPPRERWDAKHILESNAQVRSAARSTWPIGTVLGLLPATLLFAANGFLGLAHGLGSAHVLLQRGDALRRPFRAGFHRAAEAVDSRDIHPALPLLALLPAAMRGLSVREGTGLPFLAPDVAVADAAPGARVLRPLADELLQRENLAVGRGGLARHPCEHAAGPCGLRRGQPGLGLILAPLRAQSRLTGLPGPFTGLGKARRRFERDGGQRYTLTSGLSPPFELAHGVAIGRAGLRRDPGRSGPQIARTGLSIGARYFDRRRSSASSRPSIRRSISVW